MSITSSDLLLTVNNKFDDVMDMFRSHQFTVSPLTNWNMAWYRVPGF